MDALNAVAANYLGTEGQAHGQLDEHAEQRVRRLKVKRASIIGQIAQLKSLRVAAYGAAGTPPDPVINFMPVFIAGHAAGKAVRFAYDQLGRPTGSELRAPISTTVPA